MTSNMWSFGRPLWVALFISSLIGWGLCQPTELFISEYCEGSGNSKAIELFNGTGASIDLAAGIYTLEYYFNGSNSAGFDLSLTGTVADGDVFVIAHSSADTALLNVADQTSGSGFFNGDDAVVLKKNGTIIDSIGQVGFDPGSEWGSGNTSTQNNTIRRKDSVCAGDTNAADVFDPSLEWDGFAQDTFDGFGAHSVSCGAASFNLLLTEFVVTPTSGEFIEIYNPGPSTVDLSDVYVTDATYAGGGAYYYNIVTGSNAGGGGFGDFLAQFPAGASIAPDSYQTVALNGSDNFSGDYGVDPTYELYEDGGSPDLIPDMLEPIAGSISNQGGLTNSGEVIVLFYWDGTSDLVADLDYAVWGDKAEAVDKTGVSVDGPDGDAISSTFLNDTTIASQDVVSADAHASGYSYTRMDLSEGTEILTGGNGISGNDETSENLSVTWSEQLPSPNAGFIAPPSTAELILLTEIAVQPTAGEFVEIYNPGASQVDLSDYYLTDATYSGGSVYYYNIVTGIDAGGGGFTDFHARFPDGATIGAGEYQTIALAGSDGFSAEYGMNPTYELFEDGAGPDGVPDMREALAGSINNQGGLSNSGEIVILYYWDGATDLVTDIDYAVWGDKAEAVDKTAVTVDGPDADTTPSAYQDDTAIGTQEVISDSSHPSGQTYNRVDYLEGTETQTGGNGYLGHDETSENLSQTWANLDPSPNAQFDTGWLINEFQADPDATNGDANGDGSVNTSEDEFVEIFNNSGSDVDISGWTISDGFGLRHTFPTGTVVADQCCVVVFGGGTPTGDFGQALVQVASTGSLGLNNSGDDIIFDNGVIEMAHVTYGSEGGDNQSLTLDPDITGDVFVKHSVASNSAGALFSPGTLMDGTPFSGCQIFELEIFEIQGNSESSPYDGLTVTTLDNIVTGVGPEGFTIQTPDDRDDADPQTSNGIYVFTNSAPTVAVGDRVDVTGDIVEFYDFTEFAEGSVVVVNSSGNALPTAITFDATNPSSDPALNCMECFEGMLVDVSQGVFASGNQSFGSDVVAEAFAVAGTTRPFREPGIEYPGQAGLPVWDGNPEVFEVDLDEFLPALAGTLVEAGQSFSATGVIGFSFGDYELWPTQVNLGGRELRRAIRPVRDRMPGEISVASQNLLRLISSESGYADHVQKLSVYIRTVLKAPDVLAVQEIGGLSELTDLANRLNQDDPTLVYTPYLEDSPSGLDIEVGFLVRDTIQVQSVTQVLGDVHFTFDDSFLHDRAPLVIEAILPGANPITFKVLVLHNRSLNGIDDPSDGDRVRQKRQEQAESIAGYIQTQQAENLIVVGDFNAFEFTDGYVDVLGQITGAPDPLGSLIPATDIVNPDLTNLVLGVPATDRYSYNYRGNAQVLDHALINEAVTCFVSGFEFARANSDFSESYESDPASPLYSSDHDGLVVYLQQQGVTVDPIAGLIVSESGTQATFEVVLNSMPSANVTIDLSSSDPGEGTVSPATLVFQPQEWDQPQTVTVTGVSDNQVDGDVVFQIILDAIVSGDTCYEGLDPDDVEVTCLDLNSAAILVQPVSGLVTDEYGASDTFEVVLNSEPGDLVDIALSVSDSNEIQLSHTSISFDALNWNQPVIVTVTGVDDGTIDPDQLVEVLLAPSTSNDPNYQGLDPADVEVLNMNIHTSNDFDLDIDEDCILYVTGPPNGIVGIYVFDETTQSWVFLMDVQLNANGLATVQLDCDIDTIYGAGGPGGSVDPNNSGVLTVPTMSEIGALLLVIGLLVSAVWVRRRQT